MKTKLAFRMNFASERGQPCPRVMKIRHVRTRLSALLLLLLSTINYQLSTLAQGTAFTYQGRLNNGGAPACGTYDLTFALFNTNSGPGDTAWSIISDRNAKNNFAPVDGEALLKKLAAMPVQSWNYKWESDTNTPHLGPMAQDFKAAFYPGRDDKSISTLEFDGVELAAIQGLNQKLEAQSTQL